MNSYAIFGAGFLSGAILISGIFLISTKGGVVVYTSPDTSTASVLVGSGGSQISDVPPSETLIDKNDKAEEGFVERKKKPPSESIQPEVQSGSVQTTFSSDYITELQEQVESLIEQVSAQTTKPASEESGSDEVFFTTPTGVKIDADGNVIDDSTSQSGNTVQGIFITPAGVKIDAAGNIIE